ncbi:MAG: superoxide dismutase [Bacteroidota bacterium]|nr:superoxide dismutase [Bacteroidota bacterium]
MPFALPNLKYDYNALEPYIDAKTMEIHHGKHHNGYTNNLNKLLENSGKEDMSIEELLNSEGLNDGLKNNGGGYYNHCLFWEIMSPSGGGTPSGTLNEAIEKSFGSFDNFKDAFSKAAATRFGSGWAWLCVCNSNCCCGSDKGLCICSTSNQNNPLMQGECGGTPILGLDVWEHAYYLNYQNRRPDYINAFFNVVNWDVVSSKYQEAL